MTHSQHANYKLLRDDCLPADDLLSVPSCHQSAASHKQRDVRSSFQCWQASVAVLYHSVSAGEIHWMANPPIRVLAGQPECPQNCRSGRSSQVCQYTSIFTCCFHTQMCLVYGQAIINWLLWPAVTILYTNIYWSSLWPLDYSLPPYLPITHCGAPQIPLDAPLLGSLCMCFFGLQYTQYYWLSQPNMGSITPSVILHFYSLVDFAHKYIRSISLKRVICADGLLEICSHTRLMRTTTHTHTMHEWAWQRHRERVSQ